MGLKDQIMADIKDAMRAKDSEKLTTLRGIHSSIKNREIEVRPKEVTEDDVLGVIKKLAKQRKDSIEQFTNANRTDLADKEKTELGILEAYLPEQMSEEKVTALVVEVISNMNASSMKDMGPVMKEVLVKSGGAADNKLVSSIVRAKLQ